MKTADLKAGALYAVRHVYEPCLLLSTAVHERRTGRMGPARWALAKPGTRPRRDDSAYYQRRTDYGFVVLAGPADVLKRVDGEAILSHFVEHGPSEHAIPEGTSIEMVFSAAAIVGEYETVQAEEQARKAREHARKQKRVDEYNAVIDALNAVLDGKPVRRAEVDWQDPPCEVVLTLAQARALAVALDREVAW